MTRQELKAEKFLLFRPLLGFLVMCLVIVFVATVPYYQRLKRNAENDWLLFFNSRKSTVEEYLSRTKDITRQITSRSMMRIRLEDYIRGELSPARLWEFTAPKLLDAMKVSEDIAGISRFDRNGVLVAQAGLTISSEFWPVSGEDVQAIHVLQSMAPESEPLMLVAAPIMSSEGLRIGLDLVLFKTARLRQIVGDCTGMKTTDEHLVAVVDQGLLRPLFSSKGKSIFSVAGVAKESPLGSALSQAVLGKSG